VRSGVRIEGFADRNYGSWAEQRKNIVEKIRQASLWCVGARSWNGGMEMVWYSLRGHIVISGKTYGWEKSF
jgi:hypothetical protein